MFADVSRRILETTEGRGLGFGQFIRTHTGKNQTLRSKQNAENQASNSFLKSKTKKYIFLKTVEIFLHVLRRVLPTIKLLNTVAHLTRT